MVKSYEKLDGKRYLGNKNTNEVHDLEHETLNCQIVEIIHAHYDVFFDTIVQAHQGDYHNCPFCMESSLRNQEEIIV